MAKAKSLSNTELINSTGLIIPLSYLVLLAVNLVVLSLANTLFPNEVVLGTAAISRGWALMYSMGTLALLDVFMIPFVHYHEAVRGSMYSSREWMLAYFVINLVGLWLLSRMADNLGLGISAWWVTILLATALVWLQGLAIMALTKLTS